MCGFDFRKLSFEINGVYASLTLFPESLTNLLLFWASALCQFGIEILHDSPHFPAQVRPHRIVPRHRRGFLPEPIGNCPFVATALAQDDR